MWKFGAMKASHPQKRSQSPHNKIFSATIPKGNHLIMIWNTMKKLKAF